MKCAGCRETQRLEGGWRNIKVDRVEGVRDWEHGGLVIVDDMQTVARRLYRERIE